MSDTQNTPETVENSNAQLDSGSYEVIKKRLQEKAVDLSDKLGQLNAQRKAVFGSIELELLQTERVTTEHNCDSRDMVAIGQSMIFGYNIHLGIKKEIEVADVFSCYAYSKHSFSNENNRLLLDERFETNFKNLYKYYKNANFVKFAELGNLLFFVFRIGKAVGDIKVFKFVVEDDKLIYVDNRSEHEFKYPNQFEFEWVRTHRDLHRNGKYPYISILDKVFVEAIGCELEGKFADFEEYLEALSKKRDEIYNSFESKKNSLVEANNRKINNLLSASEPILKGVRNKVSSFKENAEINSYFAADVRVNKVRGNVAKLIELGDTVKADALGSQLKSIQEEAIRQLKDRSELFVGGENLIKLGKHHWVSVYLKEALPAELSLKAKALVFEMAYLCFDDSIRGTSAINVETEFEVNDCVGSHVNIVERVIGLDYRDYISKLEEFEKEFVGRFKSFTVFKKDLAERFQKELRLDEFKPRVLSSFVRNKLIDHVYLPLIGDNFAKQMGAAGDGKRTNLMGMLLLISPPGYGKQL